MKFKSEYINYYINGGLTLIGVFAYLFIGILMTTNIEIASESVTELLASSVLAIGVLMIFLGFGITIGIPIALFQLGYGVFFRYFKQNNNPKYIHSLLGFMLWVFSLCLWAIGIHFDIIVTV